ncbi:MAG: hypothetical protein NT029_20285 [Armatimonadetes bacterium]|nr:hypothetical protein [Armatimonadota bacterium]
MCPAILQPVAGDVLTRADLTSAPGEPRVTVRWRSAVDGLATLNGTHVRTVDGMGSAEVALKPGANSLMLEDASGVAESPVWLDAEPGPRYRVSVDDCIWCLRDVARGGCGTLFDNAWLAGWRRLHESYGVKVQLNLYLEDPESGFALAEMPDRFRGEWADNADWLRLTWHARSDKPDRPYLGASVQTVMHDYRQVTDQILRFAGSQSLTGFTTIHWGEASREVCAALRAEGVRGLVGYFNMDQGRPSVAYYLNAEQTEHLSQRDAWVDASLDLVLVRHDAVLNLLPVAGVVPHLEAVAGKPHEAEVLELMIHEQYFSPTYAGYQPDAWQKVESAVRWASERGYAPVSYGEEGRLV